MNLKSLLLLCCLGSFASFNRASSIDTTSWAQLREADNFWKDTAWNIINGPNDSVKWNSAFALFQAFNHMLSLPGSENFPFDSLKSRTVSIVSSSDQMVRSISFNLLLENGDYKNFGFIQFKHKKQWFTIPLIDTAKKTYKEIVDTELEPNAWMGALYYSVVPFKFQKRTHYLLLGFDGATVHSNKMIMDVLSISKTGEVTFGAPVFKDHVNDVSAEFRVIFEFHNAVVMNLRYEPDPNIIVLDKLTPSTPEFAGDYYYYIPSGDYDHYKRNKRGVWIKYTGIDNYKFMKDPK